MPGLAGQAQVQVAAHRRPAPGQAGPPRRVAGSGRRAGRPGWRPGCGRRKTSARPLRRSPRPRLRGPTGTKRTASVAGRRPGVSRPAAADDLGQGGRIGVAGGVQVDDLAPVPPAAAQVLAHVPAGAQQQPELPWPRSISGRSSSAARWAGSAASSRASIIATRAGRLPRSLSQQPGQTIARRARVRVDVLDTAAAAAGRPGPARSSGSPRKSPPRSVRPGDNAAGNPSRGTVGRRASRQRGEQAQMAVLPEPGSPVTISGRLSAGVSNHRVIPARARCLPVKPPIGGTN